jgi:Phosphoribosylformylglycinamidine (FGAM) synthase, synthetase domain
VDARRVISPEFKEAGNKIYLVKHNPLANRMPDTEQLKANWNFLHEEIGKGSIVSAWSLSYGGVAEALVKMAMGNALGVDVNVPETELFSLGYGSAVVESKVALNSPCAVELGVVTASGIKVNGVEMSLEELEKAYEGRYSRFSRRG